MYYLPDEIASLSNVLKASLMVGFIIFCDVPEKNRNKMCVY